MKIPEDINLGKGWFVRFDNCETPVYIEFKTNGQSFGASLGFFEENYMTSVDEYPAPQSVIDNFEANEEIIYAWENDYYLRNPRE